MKQSLIVSLIAVVTAPQWISYFVAQERHPSAHRLPAEPLARLQAMLLSRFPEGVTSGNDEKNSNSVGTATTI